MKVNESFLQSGEPFGEVVQSRISDVVVECWKNKGTIPGFADLVAIENDWGVVLACVTGIETGSSRQGKRAFAFGLRPESLKLEQPQVAKLISTWIQARVFAYWENERVDGLPNFDIVPRASSIHSSVFLVANSKFLELAQSPMFFFSVFSNLGSEVDVDKVALSLIAKLSRLTRLSYHFFQKFYVQYSKLPEVDIARTRVLFARLGQFVADL